MNNKYQVERTTFGESEIEGVFETEKEAKEHICLAREQEHNLGLHGISTFKIVEISND